MGVFYKEVSPCQMKNRDPWNIPQEFSREVAVNDLKELARMFEKGGRLEISTLKTVENFLISFLCQ